MWAQFFSLPTPDFTTIRQWFLKLGIFELRRSKEKRTDWIFIIDTILEQGRKKCLLILALPNLACKLRHDRRGQSIDIEELQGSDRLR